ncbi:glycosyl Hydrolase Family 88 family protein, partial [Bacteroides fragilis str. 3397 T10]
PVTGLYFHAWDEKKVQRWCDSQTGLSHHFWGRSIGWWFMALVDVLDFVPENHPLRGNLLAIAKGLAESLPRFQHDGLWYQIVNLENREGNYQEATATAMFMYSIAKAVNRGYIDRKYMEIATDAYDGIVNKLIRIDADGTVNITNCCAVAGLGGNPYRDGSFEYYVNEPVRENDPKATGPFIMGCIELSK